MKNLSEKMTLYMDAGFPILFLTTFEEDKADLVISESAGNREIVEWNVRGLLFKKLQKEINEISLTEALSNFANPYKIDNEEFTKKYDLRRRVLVLKDAQNFPDMPEVIAQLKYLSERIVSGSLQDCNIVIIAPEAKIPRELEHYITILTADYLSTDEIRKIIVDFCNEQKVTQPYEEFLRELSLAFKGLPEFEIVNILSLALAEDGEISHSDLALIHEQKKQLVQKSGILEMIPLKEKISDIGGLDNLKSWLNQKAKVLKNIDKAEKFGVDLPKGVLIAGLPGCGKSLNAKAAAALFEVPLIRLDMGRLLGKYVGESESNLRRAISLVEAISPCVLWIDELEKAFAGIGGNGGGNEVTTRLFGTFLTWLQEKENPVFVVATANNISNLPPELLRKGRFDEIFHVGLPNKEERKKIFEIHIGKRRKEDLASIDLSELAKNTDGFSGADIECVVRDSVETAFTQNKESLTTEILINSIKNTASLSEIMKDSIDKMAKIYKERHFKNASI